VAAPKAFVIAYFDTIFYALPAIAILAVGRAYRAPADGHLARSRHLRQVAGMAILMAPLSLLLLDSLLREPKSGTFVMWPLPAPHLGLNLLVWLAVWSGVGFFWVRRGTGSRANETGTRH
jgi:hypothetical protein